MGTAYFVMETQKLESEVIELNKANRVVSGSSFETITKTALEELTTSEHVTNMCADVDLAKRVTDVIETLDQYISRVSSDNDFREREMGKPMRSVQVDEYGKRFSYGPNSKIDPLIYMKVAMK